MPKRSRKKYPAFPRHFGIHKPMSGRSLFWEYEDLPVEAEEFWGFRYKRRPKEEGLPLDGITVAGCLKILVVIAMMQQLQFAWAAILIAILRPDAKQDGWCGWEGAGIPFPAADRAHTQTMDAYIGDLEELVGWGVLEEVSNPNTENRMFFSFFKVAKACMTKARAIANCRVLSKYFPAPPKMSLIAPKDLFELMRYFDTPKFADFDERHWFFQAPLAQSVRHWFSTFCAGRCFQLIVYPMGFKYSPATCQGISLTIAAKGAHDAGFAVRSPCDDPKEIPPYWIVTRPGETEPDAFIVVFYDNFLIIANSTPTMISLKHHIAMANDEAGAVIKTEPEVDENGKPTPTQDRIREWHEGEVEFLGVRFFTSNHEVRWTHANIKKWEHLSPYKSHLSRTDVAEMVGVIIWHWTLTNAKLVSIREVLRVSSTLGSLCVEQLDWKKPAWLTGREQQVLQEALDQVREAGTTPQLYIFNTITFDKIWFAASDASGARGAAMFLDLPAAAIWDEAQWNWWCGTRAADRKTYRSKHWPWSPAQADASINRKEIWAALEVVEAALGAKERNPNTRCLLPIAIDNTTACTAIANWYFPADEEVGEQLQEYATRCEALNLTVLPVQVSSEEEAADDETRGKESTVERRIKSLGKLRWMVAGAGFLLETQQ